MPRKTNKEKREEAEENMAKFINDLKPDTITVDYDISSLIYTRGYKHSEPSLMRRFKSQELLKKENRTVDIHFPIDTVVIKKGSKNAMSMFISVYNNVPTIMQTQNILDYAQAREIKKIADTYGIEIGVGQNQELRRKLREIRDNDECSKCEREYCQEPNFCETYLILKKAHPSDANKYGPSCCPL
ncbi:MAG: hypothetical protein PHU12_01800 [Candidatus Aenigmarchaeota archaeon]|nr:hypothetical protein [Candidatus Aenigmarchaeota archaeon]